MNDKVNEVANINNSLNAICEFINQDKFNSVKDGPLSGKFYSIKECFEIKGRKITLGSKIIDPIEATQNANIVELLDKLGATPLVRSNLAELMLSFETNNPLFGRTNNPLNKDFTVGGSSGGDAALVASCLDFAIASDIGGSIRIPSSFCGTVGFKPSSDDWSKIGFYPRVDHFVESMLSVGCITKNVETSQLLHSYITSNVDYSQNMDFDGIEILCPTHFTKKIKNKLVEKSFRFTSDFLSKNYTTKKININHLTKDTIFDWLYLMLDSYMPIIEQKLNNASQFNLYRELFKTISGKNQVSKEVLLILLASKLRKRTPKKTNKIIERIKSQREEINNILGYKGVLLFPTTKILAPKHGQMNTKINLGQFDSVFASIFCNVIDLSAIAVPVNNFRADNNLVPSITIATRKGNEATLFKLAKEIELEYNKK